MNIPSFSIKNKSNYIITHFLFGYVLKKFYFCVINMGIYYYEPTKKT